MALSDLQQASNLYIGWQNTKSAINNLISACSFASEQIISVQTMSGFNGSVSVEESDYLDSIIPLINDFVNSLPTQPG